MEQGDGEISRLGHLFVEPTHATPVTVIASERENCIDELFTIGELEVIHARLKQHAFRDVHDLQNGTKVHLAIHNGLQLVRAQNDGNVGMVLHWGMF